MPAIQPARLRLQAASLAEHFNDPPAYIRSLYHLLDYYADRIRRPSVGGKTKPLIGAFHVNPPVLRQLILELSPLIRQNPEQGLKLCDALWEQPYIEFRQLSAMLLEQIPDIPPQEIIHRLQNWLTPDLEPYLVNILLTHTLRRLHQEHTEHLIALIKGWLDSTEGFHRQMGLSALTMLIQDQQFENLPVLFKLIQPLVRSVPPVARLDVADVLRVLARRSPRETAFFLRNTLKTPGAVDTPWLIRQVINELPPELREGLRSEIRGLSRAKSP